MKQAMFQSYWSASIDTFDNIAPSCSTDNCTWPTYDSLAICSKVIDVTEFLEITPFKRSVEDTIEYLRQNATLPNGVRLEWETMFGQVLNTTIVQATSKTAGGITDANKRVRLVKNNTSIGPLLHNYNIIYAKNEVEILLPSGNATKPVFRAIKAVLHWCVNPYETNVAQGVHSTTVKDTSVKIVDNHRNMSSAFEGLQWYSVMAPKDGNKEFRIDNTTLLTLTNELIPLYDDSYFWTDIL